MRIDPRLGDKIRAISLLCSLLICATHIYTVPVGHDWMASEVAFSLAFLQNVLKFGLAKISTPFFFAVAAYLLFTALHPDGASHGARFPSSSHRAEIAKRTRSLLVPFLLLSLWSFAVMLVVQSIPGLPMRPTDPLAQRSWAAIAATLFWDPVAYPLWFVRNLFLLCLAAPLIAIVLRHGAVAALALTAAAAAWFAWPEMRATRSILFFALGALLAMHRPPFRVLHPAGCVALLGLWLASSCAHAVLAMRTGAMQAVPNNLAIVTGLAAVWFGYDHVERWMRERVIQRAAAYTFFIYIAHEPMAGLMSKAAIAWIGPAQHGLLLLAWPVLAVALWSGCLAVAVGLSVSAPGLYAVLTGGRRPTATRARDASGPLTKAS